MAKPVINYKGYVTENPADRTVGVHGPLGRGADASAGVHAGALGLAEQGRIQGREDDRGRRRRAGHRVQPVRRHEGGLAALTDAERGVPSASRGMGVITAIRHGVKSLGCARIKRKAALLRKPCNRHTSRGS